MFDNNIVRLIAIILTLLSLLWLLKEFLLDWTKDELVREPFNQKTVEEDQDSYVEPIPAATINEVAREKTVVREPETPKPVHKPITEEVKPDPVPVARVASKPDDLTKVEGIGPKINELLQDAGIKSFDDLAKANISKIKQVLEDAGSRYRLHDPTSWPQQAELAAAGEWDSLSTMQDKLKGGRS